MRNEVRSFGIAVVVIEPGGIESEWAGIATQEAARHSGAGPYAPIVERMRKLQAGQKKMPPPEVISDLIVKALKARHPRPRYHGGFMATPMLLLKHYLSDRMFDRLVGLMLR